MGCGSSNFCKMLIIFVFFCSNFKSCFFADTFVKLVLLNSSCQEMAQSKTTLRRSQPNPVYKETFYFQVGHPITLCA